MSAIIQRAVASAPDPGSVSSPFNVTLVLHGVVAGNTILVAGGSSSYLASGVTDSQGNTYTVDAFTNSLYYTAAARTVAGSSGDVTITVQFTATTAYVVVAVEVDAAQIQMSPVDSSNGTDQSSPAVGVAVNLAPTQSPTYQIAIFIGHAASGTPVFTLLPPGPFVSRITQDNAGLSFGNISDAEFTGLFGPVADWEFSVSSTASILLINYKLISTAPADAPPIKAPSQQRTIVLPEQNFMWVQQRRIFPNPGFTPDPNSIKKPNQPSIILPDYSDMWYRQPRLFPRGMGSQPITDNPVIPRDRGYRYDLLDFNYAIWQQRRLWPVPIAYLPTPPPTRQPSQIYWVVPIWEDYTAWQRVVKAPPPSNYFSTILGEYNIFGTFQKEMARGVYRITNDSLRGYAIWIGHGQLPDFTQPPDAFSATLPLTIPIAPPGVTVTLYVVARARDGYGLVSQNQKPTLITLDASGNWSLPPLAAPTAQVFLPGGNTIRFIAFYAASQTDLYPADNWKIWLNTTPPVTGVDTPTLVTPVQMDGLHLNMTKYGPNGVSLITPGQTYYYAIVLNRSVDGAVSPALTGSVVYPNVPGIPGDVHGPFTKGN